VEGLALEVCALNMTLRQLAELEEEDVVPAEWVNSANSRYCERSQTIAELRRQFAGEVGRPTAAESAAPPTTRPDGLCCGPGGYQRLRHDDSDVFGRPVRT
jgi:hypothetical protein